MKSKWKVDSEVIGNHRVGYKVYRLYDRQKVNMEFNREYAAQPFYTYKEAQKYADFLNRLDLK